jgi:hypothetical protein
MRLHHLADPEGMMQAVDEHVAQAQLVLLEGLCRFNPRSHLLQHLLRQPTGQRQPTQQRLVRRGWICKLTRAACGFPTTTAQFGFRSDAKRQSSE